MNIIPKHDGHATVASRAPQYKHCGESVEAAAPHIGQLSVSACIPEFSKLRYGNKIKPRALQNLWQLFSKYLIYLWALLPGMGLLRKGAASTKDDLKGRPHGAGLRAGWRANRRLRQPF